MERPNLVDIRPIEDLPPVPSDIHKPNVSQDPQVLRDARLSEGERIDDSPNGSLRGGEVREDVAPAWLGDGIEGIGRRGRARHARIIFP